jgi:hypothetical protein
MVTSISRALERSALVHLQRREQTCSIAEKGRFRVDDLDTDATTWTTHQKVRINQS